MTVKCIAMWSGPRNLSTALMRSFASRRDCSVVDEPFYAAYLFATGVDHPLREEIIIRYKTDPNLVAKDCIKGVGNRPIEYQKHMAHHMINQFDLKFLGKLSNAFLIRSPRKVIKSFSKKLENFTMLQLGFLQQLRIFEIVRDQIGINPPIIDADDLTRNPRGGLRALCAALDIEFYEEMLTWQKGPHVYDGIWGEHWYGSVNKSTRFEMIEDGDVELTRSERDIERQVLPYFQRMKDFQITF